MRRRVVSVVAGLALVVGVGVAGEARAGLYQGAEVGVMLPLADMGDRLSEGVSGTAHAGLEFRLGELLLLGGEAFGGVASLPIDALGETAALWRVGGGVRLSLDLGPVIDFPLKPYLRLRAGYGAMAGEGELPEGGLVTVDAAGATGAVAVGATITVFDVLRLGVCFGGGFLVADELLPWASVTVRAEFALGG